MVLDVVSGLLGRMSDQTLSSRPHVRSRTQIATCRYFSFRNQLLCTYVDIGRYPYLLHIIEESIIHDKAIQSYSYDNNRDKADRTVSSSVSRPALCISVMFTISIFNKHH